MKKLICLIFITVLLGACKQVPNNKALINHNIFKTQIDTVKVKKDTIDVIDSLYIENPTLSDTVIYKYNFTTTS